ncbi:glycosyltransferase family 4 protein [Mongoliibacter ruber]|uniref:Glycosyltransferase involved in cell wall biosynthesis n=1 Tax=Mongoliibacter ruber TaxID=1750599 RepID=A0A2T0WK55_9BACT|nr:glycosyltransferase family 4 protein [Mongoliibacter ruber]PRY87086.1 glycosyltransferase involved in cell wall biosynthesis [Mongoliibacter ruber]
MKIVFIGTYPPRECGIGVFTNDLFKSMVGQTAPSEGSLSSEAEDPVEGFVVAMSDHDLSYHYPEEVKFTIRQEHQLDYLKAVKFINLSGADICVLQHEFGIFGGQSGMYILPLLHRLQIPLIVTLHTVLKNPSYNEKAVMKQICKMAYKIVVMSNKAIDFLIEVYDIEHSKIVLIEHGVPEIVYNQEQCKKFFKLQNKKFLLTFGIISRNKGIETVIKALPKVIEKHPDVVYMILGKTHPNVLHNSGEEYRNFLQLLVKTLKLEEHVIFLNEFIDQKELFKYLSASDIYITPYHNEAQITSGTLSYAVGVGSAVLSTPYWHATELLAEGRGRLFDFNDSEGLSRILMELLDDPEALKSLRKKACDYGKTITWSKSGEKYLSLASATLSANPEVNSRLETLIDPLLLPAFSLDHIIRLTDDTGIIQHAKYGIPNLKEGYCLDDNARALLMVLMAYRESKDKSALNLAPIYLSYIHYMQNEDGTFRNFLSFSRQFLDEVGSEDSFGRAIWALGYLLGNPPNDAYFQTGKLVFFNAVPNFEKLQSIRAIANTILGISYYLKANPNDDAMIEKLKMLSEKLVAHFERNSTKDWKWFETKMTYDNGILPLSLLHAAEILNNEEVTKVAMESMDFLTGITLKEGYLSVIGNESWYKKGEKPSMYAQQPVDAMAMILMFQQAFQLTKDQTYLTKLFTCFMWFLGENDLRMSLFDFDTKGCCDGFDSYGINRNQGAESSLAYLISYLIVLQAFETYEEKDLKL